MLRNVIRAFNEKRRKFEMEKKDLDWSGSAFRQCRHLEAHAAVMHALFVQVRTEHNGPAILCRVCLQPLKAGLCILQTHGTGHIKAGLNYAMSLHAIVTAHKEGFDENMYPGTEGRHIRFVRLNDLLDSLHKSAFRQCRHLEAHAAVMHALFVQVQGIQRKEEEV